MPEMKPQTPPETIRRAGVPRVPRAYAGKWVAWSSDGRRIAAVGDSFSACERAAAHAGFPADQVAIDRIPTDRQRLTGSGACIAHNKKDLARE